VMSNEQPTDEAVAFVDKRRWELASTFLARSDHSAEVLRAALLTIATAAIGFVMQQNPGPLGAHIDRRRHHPQSETYSPSGRRYTTLLNSC
jgi:hypothetical protein